jgi:hypothetical protein
MKKKNSSAKTLSKKLGITKERAHLAITKAKLEDTEMFLDTAKKAFKKRMHAMDKLK